MILIDTQKEEFSKLKDIRIFGKEDDENKFNGDLLVIGLGGVGGKVVTSLKGRLMNEIIPEDNINFLLIDSDIPSMEATIEESKMGVGLNALEVLSIYRPNLENILADGIKNNPVHPNLAPWMPEDFPELTIGVNGAEGNRQIGRLMLSNAYEDIRILLFEKLQDIYDNSASGKLDVIIVSSVAGGTGSGIISDIAYNVKAFARSRKWSGFRIGGCLLMPDVLYGNLKLRNDTEKVSLLNANGCATLKEINYLMNLKANGGAYTFESTTHRIKMSDDIFDACMLVSGKTDEQGYLPEESIYSDVSDFFYKLASNKYIGNGDGESERRLLRDVFLDKTSDGKFKVISSVDYKIPVKAMENICEYQLFSEGFRELFESPMDKPEVKEDIDVLFSEIKTFLQGKAGDDISLNIPGIIKIRQYEKPAYKLIKKGQDNLRIRLANGLASFENDINITVKSLKNRLRISVDDFITKALNQYGPFGVIELIGAAGIGNGENDRNLIVEVKNMSEMHKAYQHTNDFTRIIESIKDMVAKKLFAFPSAKKETENGYYDACIKETLAKERSLLMDEIDKQDLFGDIIRSLRQKAESLQEIYSPFGDDLKYAIEDLGTSGETKVKKILKNPVNHKYLPSDYMTKAKINDLKEGLIKLMVNNETNIDNGKIVMIKPEMEKLYKDFLIGIGTFAPEKMLAVAYSEKIPTLQTLNVMFLSSTNESRDEVMNKAASDFVHAIGEGDKLCVLNDNYRENTSNEKYISLPKAAPSFSAEVKKLLVSEPFNEPESSITLNAGEFEISIDDITTGVSLDMLKSAHDMQSAYDMVDGYKGLHIDEVNFNMKDYPGIV